MKQRGAPTDPDWCVGLSVRSDWKVVASHEL